MGRDGTEVHKLAKKEQGQYPANKIVQLRIYYMALANFFCGTKRVVPSGQDSQSQQRIRFIILPANGASHIIIEILNLSWSTGQAGLLHLILHSTNTPLLTHPSKDILPSMVKLSFRKANRSGEALLYRN